MEDQEVPPQNSPTERQKGAPPKPTEPGPPGYYCRARTRGESPACARRAGQGTIHPGEGRCKYHGGLQEGDGRLKHGMYSELAQTEFGEEVAEQLEKGSSPIDEMEYAGVLLRIVVEKFLASHVAGQEIDEDTAKAAARMIDYLSRSQVRISKARDRSSVDQEQVQTVILEVVNVVKRVAGEETAQRVGQQLLEAESEVIEEGEQ